MQNISMKVGTTSGYTMGLREEAQKRGRHCGRDQSGHRRPPLQPTAPPLLHSRTGCKTMDPAKIGLLWEGGSSNICGSFAILLYYHHTTSFPSARSATTSILLLSSSRVGAFRDDTRSCLPLARTTASSTLQLSSHAGVSHCPRPSSLPTAHVAQHPPPCQVSAPPASHHLI